MKAEWTNKDSLSIESTGQKAILVLDMPKDCGNCPCVCEEFGICQADKKNMECDWYDIPIWCPIKPLPQKREPKEEWLNEYHRDEFADGWNACLDAITGETE